MAVVSGCSSWTTADKVTVASARPEAATPLSTLPVASALPSVSPILPPVTDAATRAWKAPARARSVIRVPKQVANPPTDFLKALPGFKVELVADKLEHPRWLTVVASGMRNPVGLAIHPTTGKLWAVVNERDYLGDDLVPDFLTDVKPGGFYGWPYYFIGPHHDPRLPERPDLRKTVLLPDVLLGSHGAPLGLVFTPDGKTALVARHGSQNRTTLFGYDVVRVRWDAAGRPKKLESLVTGWLVDPARNQVYGRPAGLAWDTDGSLLIADDWGGRIWRVSAVGPNTF